MSANANFLTGGGANGMLSPLSSATIYKFDPIVLNGNSHLDNTGVSYGKDLG